MQFEKERKALCEAAHRFAKSDLVAGTWGNLSLRVNEAYFVCTPSGKDYLTLTPEDMPIVSFEDFSFEGLKPTEEKSMHGMIYLNRPDINAIIHTHSQYASTIAAARVKVPAILDDQAQILGPSIKCADYALPSTKMLAKRALKALKGRNAVTLANHGAIVGSRDMDEAFIACAVLEKACKAYIQAKFIGEAKPLGKVGGAIMRQYYLKKYAKK